MTNAPREDTTVLGFWLYIMSDCLVFASLFATYAVLRLNTAGGPDARELFSLPFVLLETLILLTSSFACGLALMAAHHRKRIQLYLWLLLTGILGILFLGLEGKEFAGMVREGAGWQTSAFLSAFFTLVGTHGAHVSAGLLWLIFLVFQFARDGFTDSVGRRLMCFALFWHFLDIIWIFIFSFVYILPLLS